MVKATITGVNNKHRTENEGVTVTGFSNNYRRLKEMQ